MSKENDWVIYKYPITDPKDYIELSLPKNAVILHFGYQNHAFQVWAFVDPQAESETRIFRFAGTGHPINPKQKLHFIGTAITPSGHLVFHLFEVLK